MAEQDRPHASSRLGCVDQAQGMLPDPQASTTQRATHPSSLPQGLLAENKSATENLGPSPPAPAGKLDSVL